MPQSRLRTDRRKIHAIADGNSHNSQRNLALLHLPQKHVSTGVASNSNNDKKTFKIPRPTRVFRARVSNDASALRSPSDLGFETQCLQRSALLWWTERPRLSPWPGSPAESSATPRTRARAVSLVERRASSPVNPSAARHTARIHPKSRAPLVTLFENLRRPKSQCWHESNLNDAMRV